MVKIIIIYVNFKHYDRWKWVKCKWSGFSVLENFSSKDYVTKKIKVIKEIISNVCIMKIL